MLELDAKLPLEKLISLSNICEELSESDLRKIAADVLSGWEKDRDSRIKWEQVTKKVVRLATLEKEQKNTPWTNASNVKYPIISTGVLQFAARTYPEIVRNGKVMGAFVMGADPQGIKQEKARRVADFINFQLLVQGDEWENMFDKLLHTLPLIGVAFTKTYYDPIQGKIINELCPYTDIFINNDIQSLETARRITHTLKQHKNDILERIRFGTYFLEDEKKLDTPSIENEGNDDHEVLEQHRYLDLDGDGYEEPYVVTVLKDTQDVLRIVARFDPEGVQQARSGAIQAIIPVHYFTDFHCIPNPDGSYYSLGLGHLLYDMSDSINSVLNQLIDAGTVANMQTGIAGRGFRIKGGELNVKPGSIVRLDTAIMGRLSDEIHMLDYKEPSTVLFQLLNLLISGAKELASINNASMGQEQVQNVASSVMASQIEQGAKVFTGIQRRVFRSLKKQFEKQFRNNRIFLDPQEYAIALDLPVELIRDDFNSDDLDIKPVADPTMGNEAYRIQRIEAILKISENPVFNQHINVDQALRDFFETLRCPNIDLLIIPPDQIPQPADSLELQSNIDEKRQRLQLEAGDQQLKALDLQIKHNVSEAEIEKLAAEAELARAQAGAAREEPAIKQLGHEKDAMVAGIKSQTELHKAKIAADAKPKSTGDKGK